MLPTPPHLTICAHFQCPLVLLSPSPLQDKWAPPLPSQEELRRRARGAQEQGNRSLRPSTWWQKVSSYLLLFFLKYFCSF
jgi:hypothetical protein